MTSTVKRSVPPSALVKVGNPLVRLLLGSPLHGVLDDSLWAGRSHSASSVGMQRRRLPGLRRLLEEA